MRVVLCPCKRCSKRNELRSLPKRIEKKYKKKKMKKVIKTETDEPFEITMSGSSNGSG